MKLFQDHETDRDESPDGRAASVAGGAAVARAGSGHERWVRHRLDQKEPERPRIVRPSASAWIATLAIICGAPSCKCSVDVILEKPEATVASLIKAYQSKDTEAYDKIVDDFYFTLESRTLACNDAVYSDIVDCQKKLEGRSEIMRATGALQCLKAGPECGCKLPADNGRSRPYVKSLGHRVLSTAAISTETCTIKDVNPLRKTTTYENFKKKDLGLDAYGDAFSFYGCSELTDNDQFAVVEVDCKGVEGPIRVFTVHRPNGWKLIAYSGEGYISLMGRAAQKMIDERERKKLEGLNKYLK